MVRHHIHGFSRGFTMSYGVVSVWYLHQVKKALWWARLRWFQAVACKSQAALQRCSLFCTSGDWLETMMQNEKAPKYVVVKCSQMFQHVSTIFYLCYPLYKSWPFRRSETVLSWHLRQSLHSNLTVAHVRKNWCLTSWHQEHTWEGETRNTTTINFNRNKTWSVFVLPNKLFKEPPLRWTFLDPGRWSKPWWFGNRDDEDCTSVLTYHGKVQNAKWPMFFVMEGDWIL